MSPIDGVDTARWKPYRLSGKAAEDDWVQKLAPMLEGARQFRPPGCAERALRILVLYGSLRKESKSRWLAYEFARILDLLGADVRVFDPQGLPIKDETSQNHPKVQELRALSMWSEGHVWVSPEQHGTITAVFKNQVEGGSQSFNVVNILRVLGRWMRMVVVPNQSSVALAWKEFDETTGRMKPSNFRNRVVDVAEEMYKFTMLLRGHMDFLTDRYSERAEVAAKGRLLSQAEKEAAKDRTASAAASNGPPASTAE